MIYTVTLNPTLDKTLSVPQWQMGAVLRARLVRQDLGGKGINVSRALAALGLPSAILAVFAGATGEAMRSGLLAAGFPVHTVQVSGETRQNVTLLDEATGIYTKINEAGPTLEPCHVDELETLVTRLAAPGDLWAFSGSLPPGAPVDLYARLIAIVQQRGAFAFLDTSGPGLRAGLVARPFGLKPNSEEAAELLDEPLEGDAAHFRAAARLALGEARTESGATEPASRLIALSRGAQGVILAAHGQLVMAEPPAVAARSPIGAGDALLAGLIWATVDDCEPLETARRAVACGTAAAMQEGTGLGDRALIDDLRQQIRSRLLPQSF